MIYSKKFHYFAFIKQLVSVLIYTGNHCEDQ
jgi:hypothetical protein